MKQFFSLFIFSIVCHSITFSQSGTIKIAKPVPKKEQHIAIIPHAEMNYTFKGNNKVGYGFGFVVTHPTGPLRGTGIGLEYVDEQQYYQLSSYDMRQHQSALPFAKSEIHSGYLKLPVLASLREAIGAGGNINIQIGLSPEYLLKTKDQNNRLGYSDFRQYNLAGSIGIGARVFRHYRITFKYSKDFFDNLKDGDLYDTNGAVIGKQKSKTNLLSFSISYPE